MKIKLWVKRLALVSVTLFVALLAAELVFRMVVWVPRGTPFVAENPDTIYITKPNISGRHISPGEFNYPFQTSSLGFRSAELGAGPAVAPRILCLGDSFTFGVGASDPETWPAQLEARLNSSGKKIEVVNAGVIGWGLAEYWVWTSNQAAKLAPSLIVVGCQAGDWRNAYYGLVDVVFEQGLVGKGLAFKAAMLPVEWLLMAALAGAMYLWVDCPLEKLRQRFVARRRAPVVPAG